MNDRKHALYRFFDKEQHLLYVGISVDPGTRWTSHSKDQPWWTEVAHVTIEPFPSRGVVLEAERAAIIQERPKYNVQHNHVERPRLGFGELAFWPGWGLNASDMPDICHDGCQRNHISSGMYYPYQWDQGFAYYQCIHGHYWTCSWGHKRSGADPENIGKDQDSGVKI